MGITREQINKINSKCKNNWKFDLYYFVCHSEKTFIKKIKLDDKCYLQFRLMYNSKNQITLHISKYTKIDDENAMSDGLAKFKVLSDIPEKRKNTSKLIEYTAKLDDNECMEINDTAKIVDVIGMIPSENF